MVVTNANKTRAIKILLGKIHNTSKARKTMKKNAMEQSVSFIRIFLVIYRARYTPVILHTGRTMVRTAEKLGFNLKLSTKYVGSQVLSPSLSIPCRQLTAIIHPRPDAVITLDTDHFGFEFSAGKEEPGIAGVFFSLLLLLPIIRGISVIHKMIIRSINKPDNKKTDLHPGPSSKRELNP
jgi:hypothetical protein